MDWLADIFGSHGLAGITGLVGGAVQKWMDYKKKKLDYSHDIKMAEIEVRNMELEQAHELQMADKHMERAQVEGQLKVEQAEIGAFQSSYDYASKERDWLRWVRPTITFYVMIMFSWMGFKIYHLAGGLQAFTADEINGMLYSIIETLTYLTILTVSWWFGSRGGNLSGKKK